MINYINIILFFVLIFIFNMQMSIDNSNFYENNEDLLSNDYLSEF